MGFQKPGRCGEVGKNFDKAFPAICMFVGLIFGAMITMLAHGITWDIPETTDTFKFDFPDTITFDCNSLIYEGQKIVKIPINCPYRAIELEDGGTCMAKPDIFEEICYPPKEKPVEEPTCLAYGKSEEIRGYNTILSPWARRNATDNLCADMNGVWWSAIRTAYSEYESPIQFTVRFECRLRNYKEPNCKESERNCSIKEFIMDRAMLTKYMNEGDVIEVLEPDYKTICTCWSNDDCVKGNRNE